MPCGRRLARYPIVAIEDPLAEDDPDAMARFSAAAGSGVQVVADDFICTGAARIEAAAGRGACNTALIKPNQAGTLSEARAALATARAHGWGSIVSARSGESEDVTVVHLAVGWGVHQLKVGSFARPRSAIRSARTARARRTGRRRRDQGEKRSLSTYATMPLRSSSENTLLQAGIFLKPLVTRSNTKSAE